MRIQSVLLVLGLTTVSIGCVNGMTEDNPRQVAKGDLLVDDCPLLSPPSDEFCPDGIVVPRLDDSGICTVGYDCITDADCPELSPPSDEFCPDGVVVPRLDDSGICTVGYDCITDADCRELSPPSDEFCPDGIVVPRLDDSGIYTVGYDCI